MEKETKENNLENKEIKIKYKMFMETIVAIEVIMIVAILLYRFFR